MGRLIWGESCVMHVVNWIIKFLCWRDFVLKVGKDGMYFPAFLFLILFYPSMQNKIPWSVTGEQDILFIIKFVLCRSLLVFLQMLGNYFWAQAKDGERRALTWGGSCSLHFSGGRCANVFSAGQPGTGEHSSFCNFRAVLLQTYDWGSVLSSALAVKQIPM